MVYDSSLAPTSVGGTTGQIQYNNAGVFGGITNVPVANAGLPAANTGLSANSTVNIASAFNNSQAILLPKWRALGYYSNGGTTGDEKTLSYPGQLAVLMNNSSGGVINAHYNSFMGGSDSISGAQCDTRITKGSDFTYLTATPSLGGAIYIASADTSNPFLFAPAANDVNPTTMVDTFIITYVINSGLGVISASVNGATPVTQNTNGASGWGQKTITCPLGANTLTIKWSSGGLIAIVGIEAYNSQKKWVSIVNAGWGGAKASQIAANPGGNTWNPLPMISNISPDLTIINIGINDWNAATSVGTYTSQMQSIITQALTTGDVILVTPNPSNPSGNASQATQQLYITAIYTLAATNSLLLIDVWSRFVSYAVSNPLGLYGDSLHPNGAGYADITKAIWKGMDV